MDTGNQVEKKEFRLGDTQLNAFYNPKLKNAPLLVWIPGPGISNQWDIVQFIGSQLVTDKLAVVLIQPSLETEEPIQSTLTTYLNDLLIVLEWLGSEDFELSEYINSGDITLAGMDRGGTASIIMAIEDSRIRQVIALSPLIDPMRSITGKEENKLVIRGASGKDIRSTVLFEEDFKQNLDRLNLQSNIAKLDKAIYLYYGEHDEPELIHDIQTVYDFVGHGIMIPLSGTGHNLGLDKDVRELTPTWDVITEEIAEICE